MGHFSGISGYGIGSQLEELARSLGPALTSAAFGAGGLLMGMAKIIGEPAGFGLAWTAAVPDRYFFPSAGGAMLGYLLGCGPVAGLRFAASTAALAAFRWFIRGEHWSARRSWLLPAAAALAVLLAGVFPSFYHDPLLYDVLLWTLQVILTAAAASFFLKARKILESPSSDADGMGSLSLGVLYGVFLMGMSGILPGGISIGRMLTTVAVLFAARVGGAPYSAFAGVVSGFALGFSSGDFTRWIALFGVGGLMAGLFSPFGRLGSILTYGFAAAQIAALNNFPAAAVESILGAVLFFFIPESWLRSAELWLAPSEIADDSIQSIMKERLSETSRALHQTAGIIREVSEKLSSSGTREPPWDRAGNQVCRRCPNAMTCWQSRYEDTVAAISKASDLLAQTGELTARDFPPYFAYCNRRNMMTQFLKAEQLRQEQRREEERRAARARSLVTDQLEGMSMAVRALSREMAELAASDRGLAAKAEKIFREEQLEPSRVLCWRNSSGRVTVRAEIPRYKKSHAVPDNLVRLLEKSCRVPFSPPEISNQGKLLRLDFREKSKYSLDYGSCQISFRGEKVCGDSFRTFQTRGSFAHLLLSDGMGSGRPAAIDSTMASSLMSEMLQAGLDYRSALKIVNAALLVKSADESMATMDAAQIDLCSGMVHFYKAGAAPTFVRHGGKCVEIGSDSLPAGILDGTEFQEQEFQMEPGDILLMFSDGASAQGSDWLSQELAAFREENLDEFCKRLAQAARLRRTDGREDDITILCCRLKLSQSSPLPLEKVL